jgi:tyrosine-protein kinase Etk/Wzc
MKENIKEIDTLVKNPFNLREFLEKYLFHWKWFALGIILSFSCAYLYLRYTIPEFEVVSTILIQDRENQSISSELSAFQDLGIASNSQSLFYTEIGILESRSLMAKVVKELEINKTYIAKGRFRSSELYKENLPFKLNFFEKDSLLYNKDTLVSIVPISQTKFDLFDGKDKKVGSYLFGENVESKIADFTVIPTLNAPIEIEQKISIYITKVMTKANTYRHKIQISQVNRKSSLVTMKLRDINKQKAEDVLMVLLEQYNIETIIDKSLVANSTDRFINERIDAISKELTIIDKDVEKFKTSNNLTDIASESNLILTTNNALEKEIIDLTTELKLVKYVIDYLNRYDNKLIPTNLGLKSPMLNQSTLKYNEILIDRNRLLQSSNNLNPIIVNLDNQISNLKISITESLANLKSSLTISLNDLKSQELKMNSKINSVPKKERKFRDIQRSQQIIESLYLYLLQKREENAITLAIKVPNAKIIDPAFGGPKPISPVKLFVYVIALGMGLGIPFIVIYLVFLLDNKVHTVEDIEPIVNVPILGDIPRLKKTGDFIIPNDERSPFTEAFRIIRTNSHFLLSSINKECKTIFVSSTISGEGKSFVSINFARILALSSKKVLLIGGDIRNPKIAKYLNIPNKEGLTHFLADPKLKAASLIEYVNDVGFDILQGGHITPNPTELLMNGRFDELLNYAKSNYDFIIIDTAPVSLVTDTVFLTQNRADLFIYVVRASYLDKRMLQVPKKLNESKKIQNMAIILNDTKPNGAYGYGYGYGYGTDEKKKNWFQKIFK